MFMTSSVDRCRDGHLTEDEEDDNEKEAVKDPRNPNTPPPTDGWQATIILGQYFHARSPEHRRAVSNLRERGRSIHKLIHMVDFRGHHAHTMPTQNIVANPPQSYPLMFCLHRTCPQTKSYFANRAPRVRGVHQTCLMQNHRM